MRTNATGLDRIAMNTDRHDDLVERDAALVVIALVADRIDKAYFTPGASDVEAALKELRSAIMHRFGL